MLQYTPLLLRIARQCQYVEAHVKSFFTSTMMVCGIRTHFTLLVMAQKVSSAHLMDIGYLMFFQGGLEIPHDGVYAEESRTATLVHCLARFPAALLTYGHQVILLKTMKYRDLDLLG